MLPCCKRVCLSSTMAQAVLSYLRDKLWTPEDDGEDGDVIRSDYRYHITSSDDSAAEDEEAVPAASQNSLCTGIYIYI